MWKTEIARSVGFCESLAGYGWGEDLEFSLRARRRGRLVLAGRARLDHLTEGDGRPDHFRLGYMELRNRWQIHRTCLGERSLRDRCLLAYSAVLDTLILTCGLLNPWSAGGRARRLAGRAVAAYQILRGSTS
jgi:GT2 family glycosyltransferase